MLDKFLNKNYYIKNIYTLGSNIKFDKFIYLKVNLKYYDLVNKMLDSNVFMITNDSNINNNINNNNIVMNLNIKINNRKVDGYNLNITYKNQINLICNNYRSLLYGLKVLNDLVDKNNFNLPVITIEDEASFLYRGIIEGYYGEPWTYQNRLDLVEFMFNHRLNTYMYAPKCDRYHRDKWYELYPESEIIKFSNLNNIMKKAGIDFYYCISPGHAPANEKKFEYVGDTDFKRLFKKLDQLIELGITSFGLLLDDIDYNLSGENLRVFKRPGIAHSHICNRVYDYLKLKVKGLKFVMCPTEYHEIGRTPYRDDLRENLNKDIYVFWTGDNVCAEVITNNQMGLTKKAFGNKLLLWENFPVSDFTYGVREFIGPIQNRSVDMPKYIEGYLINPSDHYEISKVSMITESHYAWNTARYNKNLSFEIALDEVFQEFKAISIDYINYNLPSVLTYGFLEKEKKLVDDNDCEGIKDYYQNVLKSIRGLKESKLLIINELSPWLERVEKEWAVIEKIIDKSLNSEMIKEEVIELLKDIKFSGSELFDYILCKEQILSLEEYQKLIKARRGNPWYRVWEFKRG